ncbi:MAG: response regulator [Nannocystaceae bacterium]|nr:response regulator [bacterium]
MDRCALVVDDDVALRHRLRCLLEELGIDVIEAGTLREAEMASALYEPSLMLVDGILPDGNGIEWVATLRAEGLESEVVFTAGRPTCEIACLLMEQASAPPAH